VSRAVKTLAVFFAFVVIIGIVRYEATSKKTTTTSTSTSTTAVATSTIASNPTTCSPSNFTGQWENAEGAAGTIYASVTLTYQGSQPCQVEGYPHITLISSSGTALATTVTDATSTSANFSNAAANNPPSLVALSQGSTTSFSLWYSDVPTGSETACPSAGALAIGLPIGSNSISVTLPYAIQPCDVGHLTVSPFY